MIEFEGRQFPTLVGWARAFPAYGSYKDLMRIHHPKTIHEMERLIAERQARGKRKAVHAARTGRYGAMHSKIAIRGFERKQS